jgi:hypothetical protein
MNRPTSSRGTRRTDPAPRSKGPPQMSVRSMSRVTKHRDPSRKQPPPPSSRKTAMKVPVTKPTRTTRSKASAPGTKSSAADSAPGTNGAAGQLISNLQQQVRFFLSSLIYYIIHIYYIYINIFLKFSTTHIYFMFLYFFVTFFVHHYHFHTPYPHSPPLLGKIKQIYFLEMETQYLRSNLGDGTIPPQATVDDQMRALTRAFRETEAKYKLEAEETAKDLLRLTGELNKRDRAYTQLKQFCDDQEVLKDTMKAQQQAELQRSHERRVEAMKLVETTENEKNKVLEELENIKATNNSITDSARDDLVRHKAEMEESQASFDRQKNVLNDCQLEVGKLESECKKMANSLEENNKIMESLKVENDQFESERLAAVAELRASELCREQEAAAHQKRLDDIKAQAEEIESLKAQLKTSNSNAIYMEQRGN